MQLKTPHLHFAINERANRASFIINEKTETAAKDSDFWRLILDDGLRTEIPVCSRDQEGRVSMQDGALFIEYDKLVSEYGDTYDITLTISVTVEDDLLKFRPYVENHTKNTRINECFCPLADFETLCGEKKEDVLFMPHGLGKRTENPWAMLAGMTASYYAHDDREVFFHMPYPRASMSWFGIQSGEHFLYVARYDDRFRNCFLTVRQRIHAEPSNLMVGVDHFPMARPGENVDIAPTVIGLLDGDWRAGARRYRAYADATFFKVQPKAKWVKEMTGWQRIIMRSQYGEDYYKSQDLPRIYENGAKYGIHTIFQFAWWREGMDRNYPTYTEAYPGAFRDLAENIKKVQDMGGHVILECNCHFLDPKNPYYKEYGDEVKILDINGNEVRPAFVYPGRGEFRVTFGAVQFPLVCSGTPRWRSQVVSQLKQMGDMGADCVFADCYGGCPYQPCFNTRHEHGNRVDEEWFYHRKFFDQALEYTNAANKVFACEVVTDLAASYSQFIHGLVNVEFKIKSDAFPQMFRYTFPEVITTERGIRCPEGDYIKQLKNALTMGVRLDAELYVCRADLGRDPAYAKAVGFYTEHLDRYGEFFYDGRFTVIDTAKLPYYVKRGEYLNADGTKVLRILYNASDTAVEVAGKTLAADEMAFDVFDANLYNQESVGG